MQINNTPKISIITPAYCASEHLHISIESVLAQSYRNFEMIIVEDCSPDDGKTLEAAKLFAERDSRIVVTQTKKNEGSGKARNSGLDMAKGEYVFFLDADDSLDPNTLEDLLEIAVKYEADMVYGHMDIIYPSGVVKGECKHGEPILYESPEEIKEISLQMFSYSPDEGRKKFPVAYAISRLTKRSICDKVRFPNIDHMLSEDLHFFYNCMNYVKRYVYCPKTYYHYFQRPGSTTHSPRKDMIDRAIASSVYFKKLIESDPNAPHNAINNIYGYILSAVRAYTKLYFMSETSFKEKRKWMLAQTKHPIFDTIYHDFPWRRMPFKHRIGFVSFYKKRFFMLYIIVVGQELIRKLLGKIS